MATAGERTMRVLGFDSTSPRLTVGLAENGRSAGRWDEAGRRDRGNTLDRAIDRALAEAGWIRRDIDGLALATGPGSLTAIRIGWATASGWALADGIPVTGWPVPAVQQRWWREDTSAHAALENRDAIYCVVHHRGDEFYVYDLRAWRSGDSPATVRLDDAYGALPETGQLVGPGVISYRARWAGVLGDRWEIIDDTAALIGGDQLAAWGCEALAGGLRFDVNHSPLDYGLQPEFRKTS